MISKCIISREVIAFADLGTEAVRKMVVNRFPVIVVMINTEQFIRFRQKEV